MFYLMLTAMIFSHFKHLKMILQNCFIYSPNLNVCVGRNLALGLRVELGFIKFAMRIAELTHRVAFRKLVGMRVYFFLLGTLCQDSC